MIRKEDLIEAITECKGVRNPTANTAIKLAAFYTILDHLDDGQMVDDSPHEERGYSFLPEPEQSGTKITYGGNTDFLKCVSGKMQADVLNVIDELMSTLKVVNKRLYDAVMRKLQ